MILRIFVILNLLLVTACGSVSGLNQNKNANVKLKVSDYKKVIVNDFKDSASSSKNDPVILSSGKTFADMVASKIESTKLFDSVVRNEKSTDKALLIDGNITKLTEGNSTLRLLVGMGAGSSHFDAKVLFKDNSTKNELADINVDKMSWALGGSIASSQDVNSLMEASSEAVAEEIKKSINNNVN